MGIIDFVKGGVRELMIARPDGMKHLIVYKHPDGNIPNYARLTVDMDEAAVFFKSGQPPAVGALGPGRYPLSTENIPFLKNFITSFTGGNIYQAEVFFVKNQPVRNLTFGGQMMSMRDPELDLQVTRAPTARIRSSSSTPSASSSVTRARRRGDNEQVTSWLRQRLFKASARRWAAQIGQTTFMDLGGVAPDLAACCAIAPISANRGAFSNRRLKISVSPEDQRGSTNCKINWRAPR